jgi:hypothetical protein
MNKMTSGIGKNGRRKLGSQGKGVLAPVALELKPFSLPKLAGDERCPVNSIPLRIKVRIT